MPWPRQLRGDACHAGLAQGRDTDLAWFDRPARRLCDPYRVGLYKISLRLTWKLPLWEAAQIVSGFSIPLFLLTHVIFQPRRSQPRRHR